MEERDKGDGIMERLTEEKRREWEGRKRKIKEER